MAESKNVLNLLSLLRENPELPVMAMVDGEIVGDDSYRRWLGCVGFSYKGEYALFNERVYDDWEEFKEDYFNYNAEEICERFDYQPLSESLKNKENAEKVEKYLEKKAEEYFKKAIIVNIDSLK